MGAPAGPNPYAPPPPPPTTTPYPPLPERGSGQGNVLVVRLLGLGLAVTLIGFGAFGVLTQFFRQSQEESTVFAGSFRQIVAETDVGDVWVHEGRSGEPLVVRRVLHWSFHRPSVEVSTGDGVVTATGSCNRGGANVGDCSIDLDLTVPPGTAVKVVTRTGDVRADGVSGVMEASTSTGDVTLRALRAPQATALADTGDVVVTFQGVPQSVQARTSTGDVRVTVPPDGTSYRVTARSSVGDRTVRVPLAPAGSRTIVATTSVGDVTVAVAS